VTFSVLATDGAGGFGMAVTSSSPAVAARCLHLRPGVGGASSQNITDPRLGTRLLDAMGAGASAAEALERVTEDPALAGLIGFRQITALDAQGGAAAFSGAYSLGTHHHAVGRGVVVAGNLLASTGVVDAMVPAFEESSGELEFRLLATLEAGLAAGGEEGPLHSVGLAVVREVEWRVTDVRVDWHDEPLAELDRLLGIWMPQRDDYVTRGLDPTQAPSYGVPGDL
jgi:uncharacterized Ntn-hydrolase superfamily protein